MMSQPVIEWVHYATGRDAASLTAPEIISRPTRIIGAPAAKGLLEPAGRPSTIRATSVHDANLIVGSGMLLTSDGRAVDPTSYLIGEPPVLDDLLPTRAPQLTNKRIIISYNAGWRNYYHWTIQSMFSFFLFNSYFGGGCAAYIFPQVTLNFQELLYYACGGCSKEIYFFHKNEVLELDSAEIMNTNYKGFDFSPSPSLREFATHILRYCPTDKTSSRKVYVSRRDSRKRSIKNEADVISYLEARGFSTVELSKLSIRDQINLFSTADVVVSAHGAGLSNTIYCNPAARVVELMPSSYQNPCFSAIGRVLNLDWTICLFDAETLEDNLPASSRVGEWAVNLEQLDVALA